MIITRPTNSNGWLDNYILESQGDDLLSELTELRTIALDFFRGLPPATLLYRYQEGKWNVLEILSHLIDSERVFAYRALRFARKDRTELPGYDEGLYAETCGASERTLDSLLNEYIAVREATMTLYGSFTPEMLDEKGIANATEMSVRGIGFAISGHQRHHLRIIKERYII